MKSIKMSKLSLRTKGEAISLIELNLILLKPYQP